MQKPDATRAGWFGFREQLVLATVAIIIAVVASVVATTYLVSRDVLEKRVTEGELPANVRSIVAEINETLAVPISVSRAMAHDTYLIDWVKRGEPKDAGFDALTSYLTEVDQYNGAAAVFFVSSATGNYYTDKGILKHLSHADNHDKWFYNFLARGREFELEWDVAEQSGQATVFINYTLDPMTKPSRGAVGIGLSVTHLTDKVRGLRIGNSGYVYLVDQNGKIQVHPDRSMTGKAMHELPCYASFATSLLSGAGEVRSYGCEGKTHYIGAGTITSTGWHVVAEVPRDEILAPLGKALTGSILIATILGGLAVALAAWVGSRITGRLVRMKDQVESTNGEMRLVLDNVEQGLLTVDNQGFVSGQRSAIVETWLGKPKDNESLWQWIARTDKKAASWLEVGWPMLAEDVMPLEVCIDQLPKIMHAGHRTFRLEYKPIQEDHKLTSVLVILSDITATLEAERADKVNKELTRVFLRINHDRAGFLEFWRESGHLMSALIDKATPDETVHRIVHTLKGNCGLFGLASVAEACHEVENEASDTRSRPSEESLAQLVETWDAVVARVSPLISSADDKTVHVPEDDFHSLLTSIERRTPHAELARLVSSFRLEPTELRLARIAEQLNELAHRLGKGDISVVTRDHGLRLETRKWSPFWSAFVHLVRNSVDHGLESAEVRAQRGKPLKGEVRLETVIEEGEFVVRLSDDGNGIDWQAIAKKAREKGLAHETGSDLEDALFTDGVSTREEVTAYSGRGVGLAAVKETTRALGGRIVIRSERGKGTTFELRFPSEQAVQP